MGYKKSQVNAVMKKVPEPYAGVYQLKIKASASEGGSAETKWLNISKEEIKRIRNTLGKN